MQRFIIVASIILCAASCHRTPDSAPSEIAQTFLTAYFQLDYDQILSLCLSDSPLKSDLEQRAKAIEALSKGAQDKLRRDLSVYTFQIEQVETSPTKDSAFVSYLIHTPEAPEGVPSHLTLVMENRAWKVAKLLKSRM